jgi:alpha-amylase/alpha-mannosidase (GH57 family)
MNRVHLVIIWHMHQPQYRDPSTGKYILPWTRLHALKDYWGMVRVLQESPGVHVTMNVVPSLAAQLEEYASGKFDEPWFSLAFAPADSLGADERREVLERAFQVNHEHLLRRWPRFGELFDWVQATGPDTAPALISLGDLRDLQVLSQLVWMDEEYIATDPVVSALSNKGAGFSEKDKQQLRRKQLELLGRVLPEYRRAAERGQVEISTTPFYHPILPLVCDTGIARTANPSTPLPQPAFRYPEDALEQLARARTSHLRHFGRPPAGLWPSEGSVSDEALELAAELDFRWFATDEGVLGRTLKVGFWRDGSGFPENAQQMYTPWKIRRGERELTGLFRDHYLSDLIGFVYTRMDAGAAAEDLHRRIRAIGERIPGPRPATVTIILDGENAWEWYPGNGREFLRQFYRRVESDPDLRALTASEAIAATGDLPVLDGIFPGSWINANFDIWIGHAEDVRAWDLLRDARAAFAHMKERKAGGKTKPDEGQLAHAYESVLAAEGSDWCWWFGPEHGSANDAEFDALYRKHLTEIYLALGEQAPDVLAEPIKRRVEAALVLPPSSYLDVTIDGRETNYFEWLGAGYYSADRTATAMHGRVRILRDLHYGFSSTHFFLRVDFEETAREQLRGTESRLTIHIEGELGITIHLHEGRLSGFTLERNEVCLLQPQEYVQMALGRILEVAISPKVLRSPGRQSVRLSVGLWQGGLPVDVIPGGGTIEVHFGEDAFSWPAA